MRELVTLLLVGSACASVGYFIGVACCGAANRESEDRLRHVEEETEWHYRAGFTAGQASVSPAPAIPPRIADRMWNHIAREI